MPERVEIRAPAHEGDCTAVLSYWYKALGDEVTEGEDLLDYETDKATVTLEVPCSGRLAEIVVWEDQAVQPGMLLGYIDRTGVS